ncbi:MAG: hypothetical protein IJX47_05485 [Clostridia bacterium]|nr:hypothetical protein [Clostridia bacterium]
MKSVLSKFGIYLLNLIAALWIGLLTEFVVSLVFHLIVSEASLLQTRLVNAVALTVGSLLWLFFSSKKIGYEQKEFRTETVLIPAALMFALQAIIAYPMRFAFYVTGPVDYFTQAIHWGEREYNWQDWSEAPLSLYYGLLVAFDLLCLIAILAGEGAGAKKRQADRAQMLSESAGQDIPIVPIYQSGERTTLSPDPPEQVPISNAALRLDALVADIPTSTDGSAEEDAPSPITAAQTERTPSTSHLQPSERRRRPAPSPRPQIPPECADLRKMVNRRLIPAKVVAIFSGIAFVALEGYSLWRFHDTPSRMFGATILFGLAAMAPAAAFKVWERLADRSFEGVVLDMEFQTRTKIGLDRRAYRYTVAKMRIREDGGREFSYDYLVKGTTPFGVSSRIRHYACTDYMYLLDKGSPIVCVNCGNHYSATPEVHSDEDALYGFDHLAPGAHIPDRCGYCGKSMIRRPMEKEE